MNPFSGTRIANIEKSRRHTNHQFQSATVSFEIAGEDVSLTHSGVNVSGKRESGTTVLHPNGREHHVSPQAPGVVVGDEMGRHRCSRVGSEEGRTRRREGNVRSI